MQMFRNTAIAAALSVATLAPGAAQAHGAGLYTGSTGTLLDAGGSFSRYQSYFVGCGRSQVNVQLSGFDFNYRYSDHHIDRVSMRVESVYYNRSTCRVGFYIRGAYDDRNDDDDFYWRGNWTILAVN